MENLDKPCRRFLLGLNYGSSILNMTPQSNSRILEIFLAPKSEGDQSMEASNYAPICMIPASLFSYNFLSNTTQF